MHVLFEKLRRFSVCILTVWVSLILVTPFPVTASGQTTVIAPEEGTGVLLARFHQKFKPPLPKAKVPVPPVLNLSESRAKTILRGLGLSPRTSRRKVSTTQKGKHNTVARQHPKAGDLVNPGTRVNLTLYRYRKAAASKKRRLSFPDVVVTPTPAGPVPIPYPNLGKPPPHRPSRTIKVPVPSVIDLSVSKAKKILRALRFDPRTSRRKVSTRRSRKHNTVARQNPKAGDLVNTGTRVNLTLYRYAP